MNKRWLSAFAADREGIMGELLSFLRTEGITVGTVHAHSVEGDLHVAMEVTPYDDALRALRRTEFTAVSDEVVLIQLEDRPGALASVAARLADENVNIRGISTLKRYPNGLGLVAVAVVGDELNAARGVLSDLRVLVREEIAPQSS